MAELAASGAAGERSGDDVIYEFEAGRHTIRARLSHFRGKTYLDLRTWYEPEPGQPMRPSQKGVSVPVEYLDELREAVDALTTAARPKRPGPPRAA